MILNQSVYVFSVGYFLMYYPSGCSSLIWQFYLFYSQTNCKWFKDSRSWGHRRRTHSTEKHSVKKHSPEKVQHINTTVRNSDGRSDNSWWLRWSFLQPEWIECSNAVQLYRLDFKSRGISGALFQGWCDADLMVSAAYCKFIHRSADCTCYWNAVEHMLLYDHAGEILHW